MVVKGLQMLQRSPDCLAEVTIEVTLGNNVISHFRVYARNVLPQKYHPHK